MPASSKSCALNNRGRIRISHTLIRQHLLVERIVVSRFAPWTNAGPAPIMPSDQSAWRFIREPRRCLFTTGLSTWSCMLREWRCNRLGWGGVALPSSSNDVSPDFSFSLELVQNNITFVNFPCTAMLKLSPFAFSFPLASNLFASSVSCLMRSIYRNMFSYAAPSLTTHQE